MKIDWKIEKCIKSIYMSDFAPWMAIGIVDRKIWIPIEILDFRSEIQFFDWVDFFLNFFNMKIILKNKK